MSNGRRKTLTLIATILGSTIVFLDSTVVNVALPAISDDLDTGLADQQWVVEAYMLSLVSVMLVGGLLGDQFGRRRMFIIGLIGFGTTSVLCAIAPNSEVLIAGRAAQGLAGALLVPGSLAILAATYEGAARGKAIGTWTAWSGISTLVGPAGGGALIELFTWRAIFWVNVPLIVLTIWLAHRYIEESSDPDADRMIDWLGIGLSAAGLGAPVYALIQQPTHGWGDPLVYVPLVAGVLLFALFLFWESRYRHAMLELDLFRVRNFAVTNIETLIVYAGLIGAFFFLTLFLQETAGYSALEAGFATTPTSLMLFALSPLFGKISTGVGPRIPMSVGPVIGGIGLLMLSRAGTDPEYVTAILPGTVIFGLGLAMTVAPLTATALNSVPQQNAGAASGINNGVARVAGLLAIAILGALISGQFGSSIDDSLGKEPLSPAAQNAIEDAKQRPLGGAEVGDLPPGEARRVDAAVASSAEEGFQLGLEVAGLLMILGGALAGIGLRNPPREGAEERHAPRASTAGECGRCSEQGHDRDHADHEPAGEPAAA